METIVEVAVSEKNVELLFQLWRLFSVCSDYKKYLTLIDDNVRRLAENLGISLPNTFRRFVKSYDLKRYREVGGNVGEKLIIFTREGNRYLIQRCIYKGAQSEPGAYEACSMGDIPLVQYFLEMKETVIDRQKLFKAAIGQLKVLEWLRIQGYKPDQDCLEYAIRGGNLSVIRWCLKHKCKLEETSYIHACDAKNTTVLDYLKENDCPWNENLPMYAASTGELSTLIWASQKGWPMDERIYMYAAGAGYLHIIKWLAANNFPWNKWTLLFAIKAMQIEIIKWCLENGCERDSSVMQAIMDIGDADLIRWFYQSSEE